MSRNALTEPFVALFWWEHLGENKMELLVDRLLDQLPKDGATVQALRSLDFLLPMSWHNLTNLSLMVSAVTGEIDDTFIRETVERATELLQDPSKGYQIVLLLYQRVDGLADERVHAGSPLETTQRSLTTLVEPNSVQGINRLTEKVRCVDLAVKLAVERVAFCRLRGIACDRLEDFVSALDSYSHESLMRMTALICFEGFVSIGTHFIQITATQLNTITDQELEQHPLFQRVWPFLPGENTANQLHFIRQTFDGAKDWLDQFVISHALTQDQVIYHLMRLNDFPDPPPDTLFLQTTIQYFSHTGQQTLARALVEQAARYRMPY